MSSPKSIHNNLESAINQIVSQREKYVNNPKTDFTRNRKFPMKDVINQIISMNGGSLKKELYNFSKTKGVQLTPSAFVQQRAKISSIAFKDIFQIFNNHCNDIKKYKGYRLLAIDGSAINIPRNEESETFIKPQKTKNGNMSKGYNQYHLNAIYDIMNKVYVDVHLQPKPLADERVAFIKMLKRQKYDTKTLFIADRGYPSWNMYAHFKYINDVEYLFRVKDNENILVKDLPLCEFDIDKKVIVTTNQYYYGKNGYIVVQKLKRTQKNRTYKENRVTKPVNWDFSDFEELSFRIVRFKITETTYETIFTSLPKDKFSMNDIKTIYAKRWGIETSFRELKYFIGLTNLHCKKDEFIIQEIYAALTMYNYCSRISGSTPMKKNKSCKYAYKVNYAMAVYICKQFYNSIKKDFNSLINDIGNYVEPVRPGRQDVRNIRTTRFVGFAYRVAA